VNASHEPDHRHHRVDISAYQAWLFDLDGVLTKTAAVHAAAWKQAFDEFLGEEATRSNKTFAPFDPVQDYERYVDGEPREDGVRNFLASRDIELPEGTDGDAPSIRSVKGLGNRKNDLVLDVLRTTGVAVYDGAIALVKALRAQGTAVGVVSASENTEAALLAAGIADLFDARIDGHVVKDRQLAGKPAPDSYLEGARALRADPGRAVVVEDALAGVEAGRAGHFALVVGVDHRDDAGEHDYADELYAHGASVVVSDLGELLGDSATTGEAVEPRPRRNEAHRTERVKHVELSSHHLATAEKILAHPVNHNLAWHDVVSLIAEIGTVTEEPNHRFTITVGSETETFDRPRHDDIDAQQVVDLRRMLRGAGITPESLGK
jgi:beta-phosphoglucomutase family hydrolase